MNTKDKEFWIRERTLTLFSTGRFNKKEARVKAETEFTKLFQPKPKEAEPKDSTWSSYDQD